MIYKKLSPAIIAKLLKSLEKSDYFTHKYRRLGIPSLIVLRGVFRPDCSYLGNYLAKALKRNPNLYKGKRVLDLGCGTGILGLICALNGAKFVVFSDINQRSVLNTDLNNRLLGIKNSYVLYSDLFDHLPPSRKYDLIIFNGPTIEGSPENIEDTAFIRKKNLLGNFFNLFPKYLKQNGMVIMPESPIFRKRTSPSSYAKKYSFLVTLIDKDRDAEKCVISIEPNNKEHEA